MAKCPPVTDDGAFLRKVAEDLANPQPIDPKAPRCPVCGSLRVIRLDADAPLFCQDCEAERT